MMNVLKISEINIMPVKPSGGLVAFASFVVNDSLYCGSVGIMSRPDGSYRLLYPTKPIGSRQLDIFHPINSRAGQIIQAAVLTKFEDVVKQNDRHHSFDDILA